LGQANFVDVILSQLAKGHVSFYHHGTSGFIMTLLVKKYIFLAQDLAKINLEDTLLNRSNYLF